MNFKFVEIETYVHATENLDLIIDKILNLLPAECRDEVPVLVEILHGHYGNPIIRINILIRNEELTRKFFEKIINDVENVDELSKTLSMRIDSSGNLYLRIDKQMLIKDKVMLNDTTDDVIRVKFRLDRKDLKNLETFLINRARRKA